jgi:hypothetical protein
MLEGNEGFSQLQIPLIEDCQSSIFNFSLPAHAG